MIPSPSLEHTLTPQYIHIPSPTADEIDAATLLLPDPTTPSILGDTEQHVTVPIPQVATKERKRLFENLQTNFGPTNQLMHNGILNSMN